MTHPLTDKLGASVREQMFKERALYNRIVRDDEDLARALRVIVARIDLLSDVSLSSNIEPLVCRLASMFPNQMIDFRPQEDN
jgi:hypothetical protein